MAENGVSGPRQKLAKILESDRERLRVAVAAGVDRAVDAYVDDVLPDGSIEERSALSKATLELVNGGWPGRAVLGRYARKLSDLVGGPPAIAVADEEPESTRERQGSRAPVSS